MTHSPNPKSVQGYTPLPPGDDDRRPSAPRTGSQRSHRSHRSLRRYRDDEDADADDHDPAFTDGDEVVEPLIKNGVEGSLAWQHMGRREKTLVFVVFGMLGGGMLLPFNAIITPAEYFRSSFARTEFATTFSSWIVVSYNVVSILFGLHATATGGFERSSPRRRIIVSSLVIMLAVLCFMVSTMVHLYSQDATVRTSPQAYFYLTILLGSVLSAATAYMQNAVVALSTAFGAGGRFMGVMLTGQGLVGLGISIVGIVSAWSQTGSDVDVPSTNGRGGSDGLGLGLTPAEEKANEIAKAATVFFAMSLGFMCVVVAAFSWLARSDLYAQVMAKQVASIERIDDNDAGAGGGDDEASDVEDGLMVQSFHSERSVSHPHYSSMLKSLPGFSRLAPELRGSLLRLAAVQSKAAWDSVAIALIFTVTLSIFPALTSAVQSVYTPSYDALFDVHGHVQGHGNGHGHGHGRPPLDLTSAQIFVPFHFLLYNLSDLAGRTLPSVAPQMLLRRTRVLVCSSLARVAFVPVFLACHVVSTSSRTGPISTGDGGSGGDGGEQHRLSWLQTAMQSSDAPFFVAMLLFGLSNGYVSTCIMISGPGRSRLVSVKGNSEAPIAAALLSFWLCVGLAAGSGLSFWTVPA